VPLIFPIVASLQHRHIDRYIYGNDRHINGLPTPQRGRDRHIPLFIAAWTHPPSGTSNQASRIIGINGFRSIYDSARLAALTSPTARRSTQIISNHHDRHMSRNVQALNGRQSLRDGTGKAVPWLGIRHRYSRYMSSYRLPEWHGSISR